MYLFPFNKFLGLSTVSRNASNVFVKRGASGGKLENASVPRGNEAEASSYTSPTSSLGGVHKVNRLERYFLVWTKKFKSVDEVPAYVSRDMMEKSRNIIRIKTNLSIMVVVLVGSLVAVWSGKNAAEKGESVVKRNIEWHQQYNNGKNKESKSDG